MISQRSFAHAEHQWLNGRRESILAFMHDWGRVHEFGNVRAASSRIVAAGRRWYTPPMRFPARIRNEDIVMMKKQLVAAVLSGIMLVSTSSAFAQAYAPPPPPQSRHVQSSRHHQPPRHHQGMYEQGRQQGWYRKGGRMPSTYRGNTYVVTNWRSHHLRQPPRGYHWVRSDNGDFLLVAVTTGIIASIIAAASH
jgi:Ni/Co efflux regulator RcnB